MKAQAFTDWMQATGHKTAGSVGEALGLSRNIAQRIVADAKSGADLDLKKTVELAMSAVAQGLKPWGDYER